MVDITTISTVVATISVVIGVVFTLLEVRHLARTRRTDVIMRIYESFRSKEIVEAIFKIGGAKYENYDDYVKKYGLVDAVQVIEIFESVGILLKEGLVDTKLVYSLFVISVITAWQSTLQTLIIGMRKASNQPLFFSHVDYLFKRLDSYKKEKARI
jgi:hypothetical protein